LLGVFCFCGVRLFVRPSTISFNMEAEIASFDGLHNFIVLVLYLPKGIKN
jgi:hypothetical protein